MLETFYSDGVLKGGSQKSQLRAALNEARKVPAARKLVVDLSERAYPGPERFIIP